MKKQSLFAVIAALFMLSCSAEESRPAQEVQSDYADAIDVYQVQGRYLSTTPEGTAISVVHETVPDVMNAMRMNFRIDDVSVAEPLRQGDIIAFDMVRTDRGWYARNITVLPDDTQLNLPDNLQQMGRR